MGTVAQEVYAALPALLFFSAGTSDQKGSLQRTSAQSDTTARQRAAPASMVSGESRMQMGTFGARRSVGEAAIGVQHPSSCHDARLRSASCWRSCCLCDSWRQLSLQSFLAC